LDFLLDQSKPCRENRHSGRLVYQCNRSKWLGLRVYNKGHHNFVTTFMETCRSLSGRLLLDLVWLPISIGFRLTFNIVILKIYLTPVNHSADHYSTLLALNMHRSVSRLSHATVCWEWTGWPGLLPFVSVITISSYGVFVNRAFSLGSNLYLLTIKTHSILRKFAWNIDCMCEVFNKTNYVVGNARN